MNVYDFDGTLYDGDSTVDFLKFAWKTRPLLVRYLPRQFWGFVLYGLKRIGKTELKEYFFAFLRGIDGDKLAEDFWDQNEEKIFSWYSDQHRYDDIVISASPEFLLKPICRRLGIEYLIASRVDVRTGRFTGENCRGQEKVRRLESEYGVTRIDQFYSDSDADLPLAAIAQQAFLVKKGVIRKWDCRSDTISQ